MSKTSKKSITKSQYLQLVGLFSLAESYLDSLSDIEKVIVQITGEKGPYPDSIDRMYNRESVDEVLKALNIKPAK